MAALLWVLRAVVACAAVGAARSVPLLKADFFGFSVLGFGARAFSFYNIIDRLLRRRGSFFFFVFFGCGRGCWRGVRFIFAEFETVFGVFDDMYAYETEGEEEEGAKYAAYGVGG